MIDPALRDAHVAAVAARADTAVVLVDVVLGHGAAADPVGGLVSVLEAVEGPLVVVHVCGTDDDPQSRRSVVERLSALAPVVVADSNADAVATAVRFVTGAAS